MSNLSSLLDRYKALVIFDTETSGLDPEDNQIIELAALRVERTAAGALRIAGKMDTFIKLPEGEQLPENIVTLTGITDRLLETEGVQSGTAVSRFLKLAKPGPVLMVALSNYPDIIQCGDAFDLRRDDWELGKRFSKDQPTEKSTEAARDGDATDPADAPSDANLPTREECDETESREEAPRQRNEFDDDVIDILLELRDERYQLSQINSKNRRYSFEVRALEYAVSILEVVT